MLKKLLISVLVLIGSIHFAYSLVSVPLECNFQSNNLALPSGYQTLFTTSANLSAHVSINLNEYHTYNRGYQINCNSDTTLGNINFKIRDKTSDSNGCNANEQEVLYLTGENNARVAAEFNNKYHSKVLCAEFKKSDGVMHIVWKQEDFGRNNYECLFKTNDVENGLVSSCDAKFDGSDQYKYTVWGMLFDSIDSLNCNTDCSSKIDERVYSICSAKFDSCGEVPLECDGSLYGSWVNYNETHEIKCSASWQDTREKVFSTEEIKVESSSVDCPNLQKIAYPVILDNEQVVMNIYVCGN